MNFIVLVILIALLIWVLMQLSKKKKTGPEPLKGGPPRPDLANLKASDARAGDVISIAGVGDNFSDLDFTADRYSRIDAGAHPWIELGGAYRERRVSLRVAGDEDIEVAVHNDPRKLTIEDLGLTEDDLASIDERQNTGDNFAFDDKNWLYVISREGQSQRSDRPQPDGFYYWEFRQDNGPGILGLRKSQGDPFAVTLWNSIRASDVTVYRANK